ncbi:MAG: hypothetical protein WAV48_06450 [Candidatus Magasanikiibacteriota bacterium]
MKYIEYPKIKFVNLLELEQAFKDSDLLGLTKKEFDEVWCCRSLLVHLILFYKKRFLLGKIMDENNPFDIIIVDEDILKNANEKNRYDITGALPIQLKTIRKQNIEAKIPVQEWIKMIEKITEKIDKTTKIAPHGVLHLHNIQPFEETGVELITYLKNIKIPTKYPFTQVLLSILIDDENDPSKDQTVTWQLYPTFTSIGLITDEDKEKLRDIYNN